MLVSKVTLMLFGDSFFPSQLVKNLKGEYVVSSLNDPHDPKDKETFIQWGYGTLFINKPQQACIGIELEEYEKWFIDFLELHHASMLNCGVDEIKLFIEIFYTKQCNFEIFSKSSLKAIGKYDITLPISVYNVSNREIEEILTESGYTKKEIENLNIEEN